MEELRNVLEVDVGDIPIKTIEKDKDGFYLFVQGDVEETVQGVVKGVKQSNVTAKYYFPIIKKDLAMFLFYNLNNFSYESNQQGIRSQEDRDGYYKITKQFLPQSEFYETATKITKIYMLLCNEGKLVEVAYDPKYELKKYEELRQQEILTNTNFSSMNKAFSNFEYKAKF